MKNPPVDTAWVTTEGTKAKKEAVHPKTFSMGVSWMSQATINKMAELGLRDQRSGELVVWLMGQATAATDSIVTEVLEVKKNESMQRWTPSSVASLSVILALVGLVSFGIFKAFYGG